MRNSSWTPPTSMTRPGEWPGLYNGIVNESILKKVQSAAHTILLAGTVYTSSSIASAETIKAPTKSSATVRKPPKETQQLPKKLSVPYGYTTPAPSVQSVSYRAANPTRITTTTNAVAKPASRRINFNNTTYNLDTFQTKVIEPLRYITKKKGEPLNEKLVIRLGFVENFSHLGDRNAEMALMLQNFQRDNYKALQSRVSPVGAKGVFQIMDATKQNLNSKYGSKAFLDAHRNEIMKKYQMTDLDMAILENALYCNTLINDIKTQFKGISGVDIAGVYNMWPRYMKQKEGTLNSETKGYIDKYNSVVNKLI